MIATLGEAHDLGWQLRVYYRGGKGEAMKKHRGCTAYINMDVATLVWTRGRDFPISNLDSRMRCPRCRSRRVMIAFQPPANEGRKRA